jgi:hypothetical protein
MTNSNKYTLKHLHSIQTKGIIWKMAFDDHNQQIAWECRTDKKELFIYVLDFNSGKLLIEQFLMEDGWGFSLDLIRNNHLYFSNYEQEFSPVKKGIIAFHINSKSIVWQNYTSAVEKYTKEGILVYDARIFPRKFLVANYNDGILSKTQDIIDTDLKNEILVPKNNYHDEILEETDLLNFKDLTFKSVYKKSNNEMNQILRVSKKDDLIFEDILNTSIQNKHIQPFVIWRNKLLYIKNKSEFVSYLV